MANRPGFLSSIHSGVIAGVTTTSGGASTRKKLRFSMQPQTETQWCWAAVSTSVVHFFDSASTWTQCKVANRAWNRTDCCGVGSSGACNKPWYLDLALQIVDVFDRMVGRPESFANCKNEIDNDRPLCLRVGWAIGGGHFLAIVGWKVAASGDEYFYVDDPIYGAQIIRKSKLEKRYQGNGTWTHSYYTNPPTGGGVAMASASPIDRKAIGA